MDKTDQITIFKKAEAYFNAQAEVFGSIPESALSLELFSSSKPISSIKKGHPQPSLEGEPKTDTNPNVNPVSETVSDTGAVSITNSTPNSMVANTENKSESSQDSIFEDTLIDPEEQTTIEMATEYRSENSADDLSLQQEIELKNTSKEANQDDGDEEKHYYDPNTIDLFATPAEPKESKTSSNPILKSKSKTHDEKSTDLSSETLNSSKSQALPEEIEKQPDLLSTEKISKSDQTESNLNDVSAQEDLLSPQSNSIYNPPYINPMKLHNELAQCSNLNELQQLCIEYHDILRTDLEHTNLVFGVGNPHAKLMIIGEAPGENEDKQGEPFVGAAGKLLDKILEAIHFQRSDVYIANILKHRPPKNRDPLPEERDRSLPFLLRQIEIIQPWIVLCMGRISARTLLGAADTITLTELRGKFHPFLGKIDLAVTYHPAALLRNSNWKRPTWDDVKMVRARYDELITTQK